VPPEILSVSVVVRPVRVSLTHPVEGKDRGIASGLLDQLSCTAGLAQDRIGKRATIGGGALLDRLRNGGVGD